MEQTKSSPERRVVGVGKRRNGLQPACENCRKAKIRCDITSSETACARCRKRKVPVSCVFLKSPMTRTRLDISLKKAASPSPSSYPTSPGLPTDTPLSSNNLSTISTVSSKKNSSTPGGYLGSTSYIATLQHSEIHPSKDDVEGDTSKPDHREVALGVNVLKHFPKEKTCHMLLDYFLSNTMGLIGLPKSCTKQILVSMFTTFGASLKIPYNDDDLEAISKQIIETGQTTDIGSDDPTEWIGSISGSNIRWEIIGLFFVSFCYSIIALSDSEYALIDERLARKDRKVCLRELKTCIENCMELSRNSLGPLFCNLLYKNLLLETLMEGDSSLSVWRLHHDLIAIISAVGLHCYQGTPTVTLRSELAKRLSACCFYNDKELSMFTGRPPALSHRYYTCSLPLDITDEALLEGGERLRREIDALDEHGWNQRGEVNDATRCIVLRSFGVLQDEVMELFVGSPAQFSLERVNSLKTRAEQLYAQIPYLKNVTQDFFRTTEPDALTWRCVWSRLDYLRIRFLLERLSVERGQEGRQKLLDVSREIVDLTVFLWLQRDKRGAKHFCDDFTVLAFGMPSTVILCTELLRQVRHPNSYSASEKLPKSEVVQSLSFMIGFLEWIEPEAGNYALCQKMTQVIKRVLEQVFNPSPLENQTGEDLPMQGFDSSLWDLDGVDNFDWLNSVDWGRGPFLDLPGAASWSGQ